MKCWGRHPINTLNNSKLFYVLGHDNCPSIAHLSNSVLGELWRHVVECLVHNSGPLRNSVVTFYSPRHAQLELQAVDREGGHALLEVGVRDQRHKTLPLRACRIC